MVAGDGVEGARRPGSQVHDEIVSEPGRPLAGNTGTQIEADMVPPLADYPLHPGTRLVLGGSVRFRFEIA